MSKRAKAATAQPHKSAEDKTIEILQQGVQFWKTHHGRALVRCGIGILILVLILAVIAATGRKHDDRLAEGYRLVAEATTAPSLIEIAERFKGTQPGAMASLQAAQKLFEESLFERALNQYSRFLKDYPKHPQAGNAFLGEACSMEALDKYIEAENKFAAAAEAFADPGIRAKAYMGAGRSAEAASRLDKAKVWYELAVSVAGDRDTSVKDLAAEAIKRLGKSLQNT